MKLSTPAGFKDYLAEEAIKRRTVLDKLVKVYQKFGFDPLETPTLEYAETLTGKYGEEEKLIYQFETPGQDKVALRYDQTVPLARVIAQYGPTGAQKLPLPLKRYQIQSSFRAEKPQKGRYREFVQCDADIVGISSTLADAELLALVYELYKSLGLDIIIKINDRNLFQGIENKYLAAIDKLNKIGKENVIKELLDRGLSFEDANNLFVKVTSFQPTDNLKEIMSLYFEMGYPQVSLLFEPILVRGLDYYTGIIMETVLKSDTNGSSLGGGGRWDNLIGKFTGSYLPATGYSIGLDRTVEAIEEQGLFKNVKTNTKVLVAIFDPNYLQQSIKLYSNFLKENISTEIWLNKESKLEKQFKYADQKGIPFVALIGPEEDKSGKIILKNFANRSQESLTLDELIAKLRQ